jgi:hypothetical protein
VVKRVRELLRLEMRRRTFVAYTPSASDHEGESDLLTTV